MKRASQTATWAAEYLRAAVIGLAAAAGCLAFRWLVDHVQAGVGLTTNVVNGARSLPWMHMLLLPPAGMLAAYLVQRFLVPKDRGSGFADIMEAVSVKRGGVSLGSAVTRSLASMGTIATGGSVGREGPIISLSAAFASKLTKWMRAPARDRGLLVGCGVAAGFASAYNAPIAGSVFALEIVLGNFAMELFAPVVVAAATSTLVTRLVTSNAPVYDVPHFTLVSPFEVVPYVLLGVVAGFVAVGFQHSLKRSQSWLSGLPIPKWALMTLGGLAIGGLAILYPEVCGNGYAAVDEIMNRTGPRLSGATPGQLVAVLLSLMAVKTIGTAITVGSGGSGGVFTPSMFVGAALGGAFGVVVNKIAPAHSGEWGGYALVGMGCLIAGTTRAPIMAVLVLFEMTLNYDIMVPLLLGGTTASLVARAVYPHSIYDEEFVSRGGSAPQGIEETVLVSTRVDDVMRSDVASVPRATPYAELIPLLAHAKSSTVFVVGDGRRYLGTIRIQDVVELAALGDLGPGIIAFDLMSPVSPVAPDAPLAKAFELYESENVDELPVTDGKGVLVGGIARKDVMSVLQYEVLKRQNLRAKFVRRDADDAVHADYVELPPGAELARIAIRPADVSRTLGDIGLRSRWNLTALSIVRKDSGDGKETRLLAEAAQPLAEGDHLVVLGTAEAIRTWKEQSEAPAP